MTMTKARDLQEGHNIDAVTIVDYLYHHHLCGEDQYSGAIFSDLATVESVELEQPGDMGTYHDCMAFGSPELAVICTDLGNWAIPAGMAVPRVALD